MSQSDRESGFWTGLMPLLSPVKLQDFLSEYWESKPLHLTRRSPDYYRTLIEADDFDFIISTACQLRNESVELLCREQSRGVSKGARYPERVASLFEAYQGGATVRVNSVERYWRPLWALCREMQRELGFPIRANLYCSPAKSQGARRHYDTHDVLVLQVAGRKHWRVFGPLFKFPVRGFPALPFERADELEMRRGANHRKRVGLEDMPCGEPVIDVWLESGDLLYLPRGWVHEAWTEEDSPSAHLSVGLHALTWMDVLTVALGQVANQEEELRQALPHGFATDPAASAKTQEVFRNVLQLFAERARGGAALEEAAVSFAWQQHGLGEGAIFGSSEPVRLTPGMLLEHRPHLNLRFRIEGEAVLLVSNHKIFSVPKLLAVSVRFIAAHRSFRPAEIPGGLSDNSKMALALRLMQDGFLRVSPRQ
ncbi:MAG: cupin domain-containing protein [Pyrinomonadaceae bacterium]